MAPDAWVLNFTNPVSLVCLALERVTSLRCVGLCHQIGASYLTAGQMLGLGDRPRDWDAVLRQLEWLHRKLDIKAAGLNHFTFIYNMRDKESVDGSRALPAPIPLMSHPHVPANSDGAWLSP